MPLLLLLLACPTAKPAPDPEDSAPPVDSAPTDTDDSDSTTLPDDDQDDDGYPTPEDCDDTDADVHPDAAEVPGNGVDDDCVDGDMPDADRDGHGGAAAGGDDCDDADAWVYPGATEWCDPIDQDCDGEPLAKGGCAGLQEPRAWARLDIVVAEWQGAMSLPDETGDGRSDVLVYTGPVTSWWLEGREVSPAWAVYDRSDVEAETAVAPEGAVQLLTAPLSLPPAYIHAGDVTGDGSRDFVLVGPLDFHGYVIPGPFPWDGSLIDAGGVGIVWGGDPQHNDTWCQGIVTGGDFDADGINDALCDSSAPSEYADDGYLEMFHGGSFGEGFTTVGYTGTPIFSMELLPDITGDGANEVAFTYGGSALLVADGMSLSEGVDVTESVVLTFDSPGTGNLSSGVADRTGDGTSDLLLGDGQADFLGYDHGAVYLVDGTFRGAFAPEEAIGCWVGTPDGLGIAHGTETDLDGDGLPETSFDVFDAVRVEHLAVVSPIELPTWAVDVTTNALVLDATYLGTSPVLGDVDGEPGADVFFSVLFDDSETGNYYLYSGWDIPWFDTRYWPEPE